MIRKSFSLLFAIALRMRDAHFLDATRDVLPIFSAIVARVYEKKVLHWSCCCRDGCLSACLSV